MNRGDRFKLLERLDQATLKMPWSHNRFCHLLFDMALTFEQPQILEVACCYGKATVYLAAAALGKGGKVYTTDNLRLEWNGRTVCDLLETLGLSNWCDVTFEEDARWYLLDLFTTRPHKWLDLAFVDASHSIEIDSFIILAAWTHLRPGGVLILDDLDWTSAEHGSPDPLFNRPERPHVRILYDYVRSLPDVNEAREWGKDEVEWSWGFVRKRGPGLRRGHGLEDLLAVLPSFSYRDATK